MCLSSKAKTSCIIMGSTVSELCAHLSAKSSMSNMAICRSRCSRKKRSMLLPDAVCPILCQVRHGCWARHNIATSRPHSWHCRKEVGRGGGRNQNTMFAPDPPRPVSQALSEDEIREWPASLWLRCRDLWALTSDRCAGPSHQRQLPGTIKREPAVHAITGSPCVDTARFPGH